MPTLYAGDVLVLDNLAVDQPGGLREWLAERGVQVLFLLPYSPDSSPIEQAWSRLKTALRTAQVGTPWKKPYRPPWTRLPVPTLSTGLTTVATTCGLLETR